MVHSLREPLLWAGFRRVDTIFAGGDRADNKLRLGYDDLQAQLVLRYGVIHRLVQIIRQSNYHPDLILAVPNGANGYGVNVAYRLGAAFVRLQKDEQTRDISFRPQTEHIVADHKRIVLVEDVANQFTTIQKTLALPGVAERTAAVVSIWDRGDLATRSELPVPHHSLVTEHISARLGDESSYWEYAV